MRPVNAGPSATAGPAIATNRRELGALAGDPKVAVARDLESAPDRRTVHCGDNRFVDPVLSTSDSTSESFGDVSAEVDNGSFFINFILRYCLP